MNQMSLRIISLLSILICACSEPAEISSKNKETEQDILPIEDIPEGDYYYAGPCDKRMVIGVDPDSLISTREHWDVFNEDVFMYCDSIGLPFRYWSGHLGGAEIGMCDDGIAVDLSKYQSYGQGYLLCGQDDWDETEYHFKFVPEGHSEKIISEIERYFEGEVFD